MKILSRREYTQAVKDSLFKPVNGQSLACLPKVRFDRGKYQPGIIGRTVDPVHTSTGRYLIVWAEKRKDSYGPYFALFCHLSAGQH